MEIKIIWAAALLSFAGCNAPTSTNNLNETTMSNEIKVADYATDTAIEIQTKAFLKALNTSGGKPMETLTPTYRVDTSFVALAQKYVDIIV